MAKREGTKNKVLLQAHCLGKCSYNKAKIHQRARCQYGGRFAALLEEVEALGEEGHGDPQPSQRPTYQDK